MKLNALFTGTNGEGADVTCRGKRRQRAWLSQAWKARSRSSGNRMQRLTSIVCLLLSFFLNNSPDATTGAGDWSSASSLVGCAQNTDD
jgi:hypothetical protein